MSDIEMEDVPQNDDLPYNPDQDPEEKRAVRKDYRSLARKFEEKQQNINEFTAEQVISQVKKADKLFNKVKGPQEATLDSSILLMASNLSTQKARALKSGAGTFDIDDFVAKLLTFLGGTKLEPKPEPDDSDSDDAFAESEFLNWEKVGRRALAKSRRIPIMTFMLGPLSIEQKKRAEVKRAKLEKKKEEMKRPQELREEDIERSENETTKNVAALEKLLENQGNAVNLFKFVINPRNFAQSVENLFHLSFLIRDGKVALEMNENHEPMIYACGAPTDEDYAQGLKKRQIVFEFDMETWKSAIEAFDITEPQIPERAPAKTRLGDKWYG